ncbi:hypothetical protein [Ancylobacter lacus]|uniref:hypothetical protein n=1 Tax=Ancylobacter lacus TaxID=2579970 RepID=UPI001BCF8F51|nr:hypothetical protein [Ancylobacter lacus]MBS7537806.1 hypothetical protein [Ancylobacter lacus]
MDTNTTRLMPPLRVRAGSAVFEIETLEEALAFATANPQPKGDQEGLIRRLQAADSTEEVIEASNAFQWWAESNAILVEPGLPD